MCTTKWSILTYQQNRKISRSSFPKRLRLRLVGCLKIYVSLQNIGLFCRALLQKRPICLSILLIVATPYVEWDSRRASKNCMQFLKIVSFIGPFCKGPTNRSHPIGGMRQSLYQQELHVSQRNMLWLWLLSSSYGLGQFFFFGGIACCL